MSRKVLFYTLYERTWHWGQALGIILLLISGFQIHCPTRFPVFGNLTNAVYIHSLIGLLLLLNAFLGLFYTITTNKMKEYIPMPVDFTRGIIEQTKYYLWGIFHGSPHPYEKSAHKKLNPLQKITYFFLLNLLLPFQLITGVLMWSATAAPDILDRFGGLWVLGPLHTLGAFFFLAFLIVHIYLTTTGDTLSDYLVQMITGYGVMQNNIGED